MQNQWENKVYKSNKYIFISCYWNVNGLNALIEKHRVADWIIKQKPTVCYLQEAVFRGTYTHTLNTEGMEKQISCEQKGQKRGGWSTRVRENGLWNKGHKEKGHYIMITKSV